MNTIKREVFTPSGDIRTGLVQQDDVIFETTVKNGQPVKEVVLIQSVNGPLVIPGTTVFFTIEAK